MAIEASVGAQVGNYILVKKLGEGGMAEVWLARHAASAQLRAIKFLNKQFQGIPEVEARFQTEGESQLVHPNIVRIYEVGQHTGSSYLVMDFIDGRDLEKILDSRRGPLTVPESVDIAMQILSGLGFAHASGIVHRDIKPSNVLVDSEGQAYLMDFGIAKALRGTRSVTQVNSRLGTPDYMSPEQIRNPRDVDRRSDIYSFGCMFYELLTGWPPFDRGAGYETEHDIKTAHVAELPTPPVERKAGLPAELNEITLHCLAKAKEDRPQSCEEILAALDAFRAQAMRAQQAKRGGMSTGTGPAATQPGVTGPALPDMPATQAAMAGNAAAPRRATEVIPAAGPAFPNPPATPAGTGFGNAFAGQMRTPTLVDDAIAGHAAMVAAEAQPFANLPPVPTYVPPAASTAASKPKSNRTGMMVVGGVLLLAAVGGGAWAILHKEPPPKEEPPVPVAQVPAQVSSGGNTAGQSAGTNANPNPKPLPKQEPAAVKPPTQTLPKPKVPVTPTLASGTLIWTGDPAATGKHVQIVRSMGRALQGGDVTGKMFPAAPIQIKVRPAGAATVIGPSATTSYNTLDLFLPNPGQQTISLDWTELPNPQ